VVQTQQKTGYSFTLPATSNYTAKVYTWRNRVPQKALERLERLDAKVSRAVLRGRGGGNTILLPDTSGIAVIHDRTGEGVWAAEVTHRSDQIREGLAKRRRVRRSRRQRHTRYRAPRWHNRRRPRGWLTPCSVSRVQHLLTWVKRLCRWCPVGALSLELVCFDTALLANPDLAGEEYQRGTLFGTELRYYLLTKWDYRCAYCGIGQVPLEIDHVQPRSKGGSDRVANLVIACRPCNEAKGNQSLETFLADCPQVFSRVQAQRKAPLRDAAAVNSSRWALFEQLKAAGLPLETGSGGRTKGTSANKVIKNLEA
jgi:5-methylcytosine-specific restriction endonuclease McrA